MSAPAKPPVWDIFCRVVDNFGDIGVCWRLGRQLAAEHGLAVRLWVDDLSALSRLRGQDRQLPWEPHELKVLPWESAERDVTPGAVVIEAFGCELPQEFVKSMAHQNKAPLWINLEYLSAEDWIEGCHGLVSPHPRLPLRKFFFFPGFTERSGGLIREAGLLAEREAFQADPQAQQAWWENHGGTDHWAGRFNISLFAYEVAGLPSLLASWAQGRRPVRLLVPQGRVLPGVAAWFNRIGVQVGDVLEAGALRCHVLPFLTQPEYDRLLWACDFNVVRGEDSFLRAQWAGKPFLWHIYRQTEDSHLVKLAAFMGRYLAGLEKVSAAAILDLTMDWNRDQPVGAAWADAMEHGAAWASHARAWADQLAGQTDLAHRLVGFSKYAVE